MERGRMSTAAAQVPQKNNFSFSATQYNQSSRLKKISSPSISGGLPFLAGSLPLSNYHPVELLFASHNVSNYPHITDFIQTLYTICSHYPSFSPAFSLTSSKSEVIEKCLKFLNQQSSIFNTELYFDDNTSHLHIISATSSEYEKQISIFPIDYLPHLEKYNPALFKLYLSFLKLFSYMLFPTSDAELMLINDIEYQLKHNKEEVTPETEKYFFDYTTHAARYYELIHNSHKLNHDELLSHINSFKAEKGWEKTLLNFMKEGIILHQNHNFDLIDEEIIKNHEQHTFLFDLDDHESYVDFLTNNDMLQFTPSMSFNLSWGYNESIEHWLCMDADMYYQEGAIIPIEYFSTLTPENPTPPESLKLTYDLYTEYFLQALEIHELLTEVFSNGNTQ
jgi:hypothetical protein